MNKRNEENWQENNDKNEEFSLLVHFGNGIMAHMTEKEYQDFMKRKSDMENMLKEQKLNASKK